MGSRAACDFPLMTLQLTEQCGEVITVADLWQPSVCFHLRAQKHILTGRTLGRTLKTEPAEVRQRKYASVLHSFEPKVTYIA